MQYAYAEVWVTAEGMPTQVRTYEKNGDWTNVLLFGTQKNALVRIDDLKFKNLPKTVKVIKG